VNIHVRALKNSFWTPERDLELIEAIKAEKSWGEIAGAMGKHPSAVAGRIKRLKDAGAVVVPSDYRIKQVAIANKARAGKPVNRPEAVLEDNFQIVGIHGVAGLESHHCRFIANDDASHPIYCGHTIEKGSFCAHHRAIVFVPHDDRMGAAR
jgi:DNA-binding Lrp family transcriptional regulator